MAADVVVAIHLDDDDDDGDDDNDKAIRTWAWFSLIYSYRNAQLIETPCLRCRFSFENMWNENGMKKC